MDEKLPVLQEQVQPGAEMSWSPNLKIRALLNARNLLSSDIPEQRLKGAGIFLSEFTANKEYAYEEQQAQLLQDNLARVVQMGLENPSLHKKLLSTLNNIYYQNRDLPIPKEDVLGEVLRQVSEVRSDSSNMNKAAFLRRLYRYVVNTYGQSLINGIGVTLRKDDPYLLAFYHQRDVRNPNVPEQFHDSLVDFQDGEAVNALHMLRLEQERPGICSRLQSNYGINNFYRYSAELLFDLDTTGEDTSISKRVLVIVAKADHSGVFSTPSVYKYLLRLKRYGIMPLLLEVNELGKLGDLVNKLDPSVKKSVFQAVIHAHGSSDGMQLAEHSSIGHEELGQFREIMNEFPGMRELILASCSTAGEADNDNQYSESIAEEIRNILRNVQVVAPKKDINTIILTGKRGVIPFYFSHVIPRRAKRFKPLEKK